MSRFSLFSPTENERDDAVARESRELADAIRALLARVPEEDRDRLRRDLSKALDPIPLPRAGELLGTIARLLPIDREWTVADVRRQIDEIGVTATNKEIYNSLGYLTRKGHVRRVGYGRYLVAGVEVITSDELGGEPVRYEDE